MQKLDIGRAIRMARTGTSDRSLRGQRKFAAAVATSQGHLSRVENGVSAPSLALLLRAAGIVGMRLSDLIALGEQEG